MTWTHNASSPSSYAPALIDPEDYRLDDRELAVIFGLSIFPVLFGDADRSDEPLAILVGAQPGAGKSRAGAAAAHESRQPIVEIIGDDLRAFHPRYRQLLALDPSAMPDATAQAAGAWVERCIQYAARQRISVLVEGTFRNPSVATGTAQLFRENGFRVQVNLVAVPAPISHLSIADRFVSGIQEHGHGRFTSVDAHDSAMSSLPATMKALQEAAMPWDQFVVRDRNGVLIRYYGNELDDVFARAVVTQREWRGASLAVEDYRTWLDREYQVTQFLQSHYPDDVPIQKLLEQLCRDRIDVLSCLQRADTEHRQAGRTPKPWKRITTPAIVRDVAAALDRWVCTDGLTPRGHPWHRDLDPATVRWVKTDQWRRAEFIDELVRASWRRVFGHSHAESGVRSLWAEQDQAVVLTPYLAREGKHIFGGEIARFAEAGA